MTLQDIITRLWNEHNSGIQAVTVLLDCGARGVCIISTEDDPQNQVAKFQAVINANPG